MGLFDFIQQKKNTDIESVSGGAVLSTPDVIAPSAISINPRSINVSGKLSRIFYAVSYPRYLNDGWLEPVINLEREIDTSIVIHPIDTLFGHNFFNDTLLKQSFVP